MKKFIFLFIVTLGVISYGQVIKNVSFDYNRANQVFEIEYYYGPWNDEDATEIKLEVSTNGGSTFNPVKSVTGDVGLIQKRGTKKIYWSVFNDYEELDGYIVFRVLGYKAKTVGQVVKDAINDLLLGSKEVREYNERVQFYYGFPTFKYNDNGVQKFFEKSFDYKGGSLFGMKITFYPLIWDIYYLNNNFELKKDLQENLMVKDAGIVGMGGSVSYTLLPIFPYIQPYIGLGYFGGAFYVGDKKDAIERRKLSTLYLNLGVQLSLAEWLKFNITYMKASDKNTPAKDWNIINYNVALKF